MSAFRSRTGRGVGTVLVGAGAVALLTLAPETAPAASMLQCLAPAGPEYYQMDLVPTRSVPGAARSRGAVELTFDPSPFGLILGVDGSYRYRLHVSADRLPPARGGDFVVWVSTPQLDDVRRLGVIGEAGEVSGSVTWNKFLVFITLEPAGASTESWEGPVVMRGISRSGLMHTMAGHGPFEEENCAAYGY